MFYYEMHTHSQRCSACASSNALAIVDAAKQKGYAGLVFTNHFYGGNTAVDRRLEWRQFVRVYQEDWKEAAAYGQSCGVDVLFGLEEAYAPGKEFLVYGIAPELIANTPALRGAGLPAWSEFVHQHGGWVVCAHPFRDRPYIPDPDTPPNPAYFDAIEVFNRANPDHRNELARVFAKQQHLAAIAGGDVHHTEEFGHTGLAFPTRIQTNQQLMEALKSQNYRLIVQDKLE